MAVFFVKGDIHRAVQNRENKLFLLGEQDTEPYRTRLYLLRKESDGFSKYDFLSAVLNPYDMCYLGTEIDKSLRVELPYFCKKSSIIMDAEIMCEIPYSLMHMVCMTANVGDMAYNGPFPTAAKPVEHGDRCTKCNMWNEYANRTGSYICYECR